MRELHDNTPCCAAASVTGFGAPEPGACDEVCGAAWGVAAEAALAGRGGFCAIADVSVALLHYKFIGAFRNRVNEAVARQEHFQGARFYRVLQTSFGDKSTAGEMMNATTVQYTGSTQLEDIGILLSSSRWTGFDAKAYGN
jgi:hypothetical protein